MTATQSAPEIPLLTDEKLAALVDEGTTLDEEIQTRVERLKQINEMLAAHALSVPSRHVKLVDEDREGTRLICRGTDGVSVPVVCTSDLIAQTLAEGSPQLERVRLAAGDKFPRFYKRAVVFSTTFAKSNKFDGKKFRAAARAELPDPEAFIAACVRRDKEGVPVSAVKVEWP